MTCGLYFTSHAEFCTASHQARHSRRNHRAARNLSFTNLVGTKGHRAAIVCRKSRAEALPRVRTRTREVRKHTPKCVDSVLGACRLRLQALLSVSCLVTSSQRSEEDQEKVTAILPRLPSPATRQQIEPHTAATRYGSSGTRTLANRKVLANSALSFVLTMTTQPDKPLSCGCV